MYRITEITFEISSSLPEEDLEADNVHLVLDSDDTQAGTLVKNELCSVSVKRLEKGHRFSLLLNQKEMKLKLTYKEKRSNHIYYNRITKEQYRFLDEDIPEGLNETIKVIIEQKFNLESKLESLNEEQENLSNKRTELEAYLERIRANLGVIPEKSKRRNSFVEKLTKYEDEIDVLAVNIDRKADEITSVEKQIKELFSTKKKSSGGN